MAYLQTLIFNCMIRLKICTVAKVRIVVCWCLHTYQTARSQYCGMLVSAYLPDCTVSVLWYAGVCIPTRLYGLSIVCWCLHTYQTARSHYCSILVSVYLPDCTVSVLYAGACIRTRLQVLVLWYAGICIPTRLHGLSIVVCWCLYTYQTARSQYCGMLVPAYVPDCTVLVLWYAGICIHTRLHGLKIEDLISLIRIFDTY